MQFLRKSFGPIALMALIATWMLVPRAQASVVFNTSLAPPGFYNGSGNPNTNFTVDTEGNLELGLSVITRFVGPIDPGASNVYKVVTSAGPLATWNFEFSVNTRAGGGSGFLSAFLYTLTVQDITAATSGPTFDPVRLIADDSGFGPSGKTAGVDVNTEWGAQNSENPGFAGFLPGFNANNHDLYKITLTATTQNGAPVGAVSVFADATVVPEPASLLLVGLGIGVLGLVARKRQATNKT
jgi:hypothetical protein